MLGVFAWNGLVNDLGLILGVVACFGSDLEGLTRENPLHSSNRRLGILIA